MKTLRFLISLQSGENDFQLAQAKCAEDVSRQLGVHTEIVFAEDDAVNQSTQVVKAIQRPKESRPDAIILEPVGSIALPQVAKAAIATGIGWAVLNRHPDYIAELRNHSAAPVFSVGADNGEIGRIQGRQFAALLRNGGSVLYIEGPSRSSSAQKRTLGMLETKPPNVQLTLLKANWTAESATRAVSSWLKLSTSQQASIHLVAAQDDAMAMGARKTFEQLQDLKARDRWLALPFTGCDGQPNTGQVWVKKNLLAATIYIAPFTGMAIEILVSALRNGTQPPERSVITPVSFPPLENLSPRKL